MLYDKRWDKQLEVELEPKKRVPTKRQPKVKREPWRKLLLDAANIKAIVRCGKYYREVWLVQGGLR